MLPVVRRAHTEMLGLQNLSKSLVSSDTVSLSHCTVHSDAHSNLECILSILQPGPLMCDEPAHLYSRPLSPESLTQHSVILCILTLEMAKGILRLVLGCSVAIKPPVAVVMARPKA